MKTMPWPPIRYVTSYEDRDDIIVHSYFTIIGQYSHRAAANNIVIFHDTVYSCYDPMVELAIGCV